MGKKSKEKGKESDAQKRASTYKWPNDLESRFCRALEEFPSLWNTYEDTYTSRDLRPVALAEMGNLFGMNGE